MQRRELIRPRLLQNAHLVGPSPCRFRFRLFEVNAGSVAIVISNFFPLPLHSVKGFEVRYGRVSANLNPIAML